MRNIQSVLPKILSLVHIMLEGSMWDGQHVTIMALRSFILVKIANISVIRLSHDFIYKTQLQSLVQHYPRYYSNQGIQKKNNIHGLNWKFLKECLKQKHKG